MIRLSVAFLLAILGVLGLLLPLLPGWPFILLSLHLLGLVDRRKLLRSLKRLGGKRGSFSRKLIACVIIRVVYRRRLNLK